MQKYRKQLKNSVNHAIACQHVNLSSMKLNTLVSSSVIIFYSKMNFFFAFHIDLRFFLYFFFDFDICRQYSNTGEFSRLNVIFKETEFIPLKRFESYTMIDFFADCGGLIGLFSGASIISIVELIYFCTLRLLLIRTKRMKQMQDNRVIPLGLSSGIDGVSFIRMNTPNAT